MEKSKSRNGSMDLEWIKENINLIEYAKNHYGIECNPQGYALCPFHKDRNPSFQFKKYNGIWYWYDWHCDQDGPEFSGTIIDFISKIDNISETEACKKLLKEFDSEKPKLRNNTNKSTKGKIVKWIEPEIERFHIYRGLNGNPVFKKIKYKENPLGLKWKIQHWTGKKWEYGKGDHELIPYNLDEFKNHESVIICEGERDADTIMSLNFDLLATTAPTGKGNWPESITKYFEHFKEITFLYDVGNDEDVKKHAAKLQAAFPNMEIYIARVPLEKREADITDYLEQEQMKDMALLDVLNKKEKFEVKTNEEQKKGIFIGTLESLMTASIPKDEKLVDPIVFKGGLTEIGGVKGSHKSFFINLLSFHYTSGKSPFLKFNIEKPGRILLIQQEISLGFNQERLRRMKMSGAFNTESRFYPITTTASQLKLLIDKDFDRIKKWLDKYQPDILALDPLSSFHIGEENMSKDMSKIVNCLSELKSQYNIGIIFTHHFSSKMNPNDPNAPTEAGAWFRGHTILTDAADCLICLHRLLGQRENPNLLKNYEDYNLVQIELRNGKWPERFAIEFDEDTFLLKLSNIWNEIGKIIMPEQIVELIEANGGAMLQKDVIEYFKNIAKPTTVKRAIKEAIIQGPIEKEILPAKGNPALLKLKKLGGIS